VVFVPAGYGRGWAREAEDSRTGVLPALRCPEVSVVQASHGVDGGGEGVLRARAEVWAARTRGADELLLDEDAGGFGQVWEALCSGGWRKGMV
jgi:hypothetical protein